MAERPLEAGARERVGGVLRAQGDLAAALDSYKAAQAIRERLVTIDPGNTGWQSNLSFSHTNIGSVLRDQGHLAAALDNHKTAQAIRERLVTTHSGTQLAERPCRLSFQHRRLAPDLGQPPCRVQQL